MRRAKSLQRPFAKTIATILLGPMAFASLTFWQANVGAADPPSKGDLSLSLNLWSAPQFSSQSSFGLEFSHQIHDAAIDGAADNLDLLPGHAGSIGDNIKLGYQVWGVFRDTQDSLKPLSGHPNDPGSDWERASIGLNFYSLFGSEELLPVAAGEFTTVGNIAKTFGEAIRTRFLQNRAEHLVNFGGGVPTDPAKVHEEMENHYGYFSVNNDRYSVNGGWELRDSAGRLFERNSQSTSWANTQLRGLQTANGSEISGTFRQTEQREERGGSLFNLYEPASITTTKHSFDSYRVTFDGANWNTPLPLTANQKHPFQAPILPAPNIASPKDSPVTYRDDKTKYLLPRQNGFVNGQDTPPPGGSANANSYWLPHNGLPKPAGVLMNADVSTNKPVNVRGFLNN